MWNPPGIPLLEWLVRLYLRWPVEPFLDPGAGQGAD